MTNIIRIVAIVAVVGVGAFFSMKQENVGNYNDQSVDLITKVGTAWGTLTESMDPYYAGETVDVAKLRSDLANLERVQSGVMVEIDGMKVPGSDAVASYHDSFVTYISSDTAFIEAYKEVVDYIETHNPASEEDVAFVAGIINPLAEKSENEFQTLVAAQVAMAAKHDLTLE